MNVLFMFIATFLSLLVKNFTLANLVILCSYFHRTTLLLKFNWKYWWLLFKIWRCPKCYSIYSLDSCKITLPDKTLNSKQCSYVKFPNHPHIHYHKDCDTLLLNKLKTSTGTIRLYPRQMFCYKSLEDSLKDLVC